MSKCISPYGEYSEHTEVSPGDGVCGYCGDVDLDAIRAKAWDEGLWAGAVYHPSRRDFEDMRLDVEPVPPANPYAKEAT